MFLDENSNLEVVWNFCFCCVLVGGDDVLLEEVAAGLLQLLVIVLLLLLLEEVADAARDDILDPAHKLQASAAVKKVPEKKTI